jgi:hypothetical protein
MTKGADYDRLLKEFLESGGDLSLCPFDTDDYKYESPSRLDEWEKEYRDIISRKK